MKADLWSIQGVQLIILGRLNTGALATLFYVLGAVFLAVAMYERRNSETT